MLAGEVVGVGRGARGCVEVGDYAWGEELVGWEGDGGEDGEERADDEEDGVD